MTPTLHENLFNDTRKLLCNAARVDATHCLSCVQRQVADFLLAHEADDALVRMSKSDIAEAVLAREALRIAASEPYRELARMAEREQVLELALSAVLFDFVLSRARTTAQRERVEASARSYARNVTSGGA